MPGAAVWLLVTASCATAANEESPTEEAQVEPIEQVLARVTDRWMGVPGVQGTGIGLCDGQPCIKIFASRPATAFDPPIPKEAGGYTIHVEQTGTFRALDSLSGTSAR